MKPSGSGPSALQRKTVDPLSQFSPRRVLVPVLIGLCIVALLLYRELLSKGGSAGDLFQRLDWSWATLLWLALAVLMMALREFGYMWQLRILTDGAVGWVASFQVIYLWNFFAAVSPTMIGGAPIAAFMLSKERLGVGRSAAIVFTTIFLDEMFFISIPLLVSLVIPQHDIFAPLASIPLGFLGAGLLGVFWSAWASLAAYVVFLLGALFVAPHWINWWLSKLLLLPAMGRWRVRGLHVANELLSASHDLRDRSSMWWLRVWAATSLAWMGRYLVLHCVLAAFAQIPFGLFNHLLIAGRQAVLWIMMSVSPTPGSAGVAELGFSWLFRDFIAPGAALGLGIIWRLISYYPYLVLGIPIMSLWIKRVYGSDVRSGAVRGGGGKQPHV